MLSVGALAFLNPLFLIGLAALPLLWLLLRATPPSPKRVAFPAVRVLLGLDDRERTPSRTPWWLLLLRCLAIAALLLAFAQPVLNPIARLTGSGPVLVLFDGGWSSAADWEARRAAALDVLSQAADAERPAAALSLADPGPAPERLLFGSADAAAERAAALTPAPWGPDPRRLDAALTAWAAGGSDAPLEIVWLHGGLDAPGAEETAGRLAALGSLKMIGPGETPLALGPPVIKEGVLHAVALRADAGAPRGVTVAAFGATGDGAALGAASGAAGRPAERRLAQAEAGFAEGETRVEIPIELPLELQNGLSALRVPNAGHAGATALLDDRWGRRAVALVSGEQELDGQPLLSGMHYLRAALAPHATFRETTLAAALGRPDAPAAAGGGAGRIGGVDLGGAGVGGAIRGADPAEAAAAAWADVIILADVGRMDWETEEALTAWVESGGLLIRFAGPKLAAVAAETDR
ncbi:MAG: BatA domain-containing protein, partial [Pseudomonadota bacterium]